MRFDSSLAWRDASATVTANRDVLLPLAGVFFMLPRLISSLLMPEPPITSGITPEEIAAQLQAFYIQILPWVIPQILFQAVGTLGILTLFTDRTRPTVAQALRIGAKGVFPCLIAQLLFGLGVGLIGGLMGGLLVGVASGTRSPALILASAIAVAVMLLASYARIVLVAPVVAVEHIYNPMRALRRSWDLTRGNALRILSFLVLIIIVAIVAMVAGVGISGTLAALIGGKEAAGIVAAVVTALLTAALALYMTAILAAIHRQLAGLPTA